MKISPISVAQPRALKRVNKVSQKTNNFQATPAFKGWKAGTAAVPDGGTSGTEY